MRTAPVATVCQNGGIPRMTKPFRSTIGMKTPTTVPAMLPIPPNRLRPPSTAGENRRQIVRRLAADRRRREARGRHHGGEACERARQYVDRDELASNLDS